MLSCAATHGTSISILEHAWSRQVNSKGSKHHDSMYIICRLDTDLTRGACVPGRAVQLRWLNNYLASFQGVRLHQVPMSRVESLYR